MNVRGESHERAVLRAVCLPREHGGWSLTGEPIILGLLVAWSGAGLALGVAAMLSFIARTPTKVLLVDRSRGRRLDRTRLALRVAVIESLIIGALLVVAFLTADGPFWIPMLAAMPLFAVQLWFDMRSKSRRLLPELSGTVGISAIAAAIVLADGGSATLAVGMWLVAGVRAAAAMPHVRAQILRRHGKPTSAWYSDVAQLVSVVVIGSAWLAGFVPLASVIVICIIAAFNLLAIRRPPSPAKVIGMQQVVFGLALVAATATAIGLG